MYSQNKPLLKLKMFAYVVFTITLNDKNKWIQLALKYSYA